MRAAGIGLAVWLLGGRCMAAPAAETVADPAKPLSLGAPGDLAAVLLALLGVVALILLLAWGIRRLQAFGPARAQLIQVLSVRALGTRERLVLVQVGEEQLLLGVSAGQITPLHVLQTPLPLEAASAPAGGAFAEKLQAVLNGRNPEASQ